jgi:allantoinase
MNVLHRESADGGRILSVVIHPWMSGQPHRIKALAGALEQVMGHEGAWSASGEQILDAFETQSS